MGNHARTARISELNNAMSEEKPAPLLSDDVIRKEWPHEYSEEPYRYGMELARDFYEAKITSGELIFNPNYKP